MQQGWSSNVAIKVEENLIGVNYSNNVLFYHSTSSYPKLSGTLPTLMRARNGFAVMRFCSIFGAVLRKFLF